MNPYLLLSDLHCHAWSAFSKVGPNGVNSRLQITLNEIERAVDHLLTQTTGNLVIIAGDLFHERGKIAPEVFNPTYATIERCVAKGAQFVMIPGNHDLAGKETTELGNAMQTLSALKGVQVITKPEFIGYYGREIGLVPWVSSVKALKECCADLGSNLLDADKTDLIIHAGLNDVIMGLDHGLDATEVASWGFDRVFAGHYHHHKVFPGNQVISIGATTQQTWGDIDTHAGFLIVDEASVTYHASHAPSFVQIDETTDLDDLALIADGNYVRVRGLELAAADMQQFRQELENCGALGVSMQSPVQLVQARTGAVIKKTASLETSVATYVEEQEFENAELVQRACEDVLSTARAKAA